MLWGVHPIEFFDIESDNAAAFMSAHKLIKTVFRGAKRSDFHNFVAPVRHVHHIPEAGLDVLGGVAVVGLSVGVTLLMRLILAN
jgi:hypothetical protein